MLRPIQVQAQEGYKISLKFEDGVEGVVDVSHLKGKGVFALWNDLEQFKRVHIGEHGELTWNEDVELCADSLYLKLTGKTVEEALH